MATIQFMPDRLNAEPVVFRGFTTPELGLTALFSTLAGIVISLPFLFFSWVMIPTIALILPLLVIVFGGKVLARIKRGSRKTTFIVALKRRSSSGGWAIPG